MILYVSLLQETDICSQSCLFLTVAAFHHFLHGVIKMNRQRPASTNGTVIAEF